MTDEKILIVDDEDMIRTLCAQILSDRGYEVHTASNGITALEELRKSPVDLIVTDIKMPGMDGLDLLERVRAEGHDSVVIFITGYGTIDTAVESLMRGVDGFVLKPFTEKQLITSVERAIKRSRMEKENIRLKALIPLFEISKLLVPELDLGAIFTMITNIVVQEFSADRVSLMLLNETTGILEIRASHGFSSPDVPLAKKPGEGISEFVFLHRTPVLISPENIQDTEITARLNKNDPARSSMSVPLSGKNSVFGVLNITRISGRAFTTSDLQVASILATQVAAALENATLFRHLQDHYVRTVQALVAAVEAKDPYTCLHSINVATYAVEIGRDIGLNKSQLEEIRIAAMLHDIGKIGVSDVIISKPERLSYEEFNVMKDHSEHGIRILDPIGFPPEILQAIHQHHERYDGKGYPYGLAGEEISLGARILNIADAIDAMISRRPYHETISNQEVLQELEREAGKQFDPRIAESARRLIQQGQLKPVSYCMPAGAKEDAGKK
ncbi:MAG: HD domain-containing phosphohydrolase [Nitrospirota bacterium]